MGRDLVAQRHDVPDETRKAVAYPPEYEERAAHACFIENGQKPIRVGADAALQPIPLISGNDIIERADLEVVLHVNGKYVGQHPGIKQLADRQLRALLGLSEGHRRHRSLIASMPRISLGLLCSHH